MCQVTDLFRSVYTWTGAEIPIRITIRSVTFLERQTLIWRRHKIHKASWEGVHVPTEIRSRSAGEITWYQSWFLFYSSPDSFRLFFASPSSVPPGYSVLLNLYDRHRRLHETPLQPLGQRYLNNVVRISCVQIKNTEKCT